MPKHIVLAYSGGLDTSVMVHWLKTQHNAKVTAAILDLGQGKASLDEARSRAIANGATNFVVLPAKEEFCNDFLAPSIRANALYEGVYPMATAIGRPLIAKKLVEAVQKVGGDAVAHGCTGKGNDQVRIEAGVKALLPGMPCLAPQRSHPMTRVATVEYAHKHNLQIPQLKRSTYSTDENLWGRSIEGGDTEDPAHSVHEDAYLWTTSPQKAPETPGVVELQFEAGIPVALNGKKLPLWDLVDQLNRIAGSHGVGRIDHVENRLVGIKSREIYEAPAATTILFAKKALEALTLTKEEMKLKPFLEQKFSENVYDGLWYAPVMNALRAAIDTIQTNVSGTVKVQLYKGNASLLGRTSPLSLFKDNLATYGTADSFNHHASEGFIEIWSLPTETANAVRSGKKTTKTTPKVLVTATSKTGGTTTSGTTTSGTTTSTTTGTTTKVTANAPTTPTSSSTPKGTATVRTTGTTTVTTTTGGKKSTTNPVVSLTHKITAATKAAGKATAKAAAPLKRKS